MNLIERLVTGLCRAVLWTSTLVIFVILVCNTALRYASGTSLQWANEVPELLFPWLVMSGVVLAAAHGAHITTSFLFEALPARVRRATAVLGWLAVAALYATLAWSTLNMLEIVHDERSQILGIPGSLTYGCVMVGMALLALLALQSAWRACVAGRDRVSAQAGAAGASAEPARPVAGARW
ncbi:MAG: TRAP transporter small permease [Delftia tsuruhatensis]